jgi:hypothetical protein
MSKASNRLVDLAKDEFGELTPAENTFLVRSSSAPLFRSASERDQEERANAQDFEKAGEWGADRVIRAGLLRWVCVDPAACALIDQRGIQVDNARIEGHLNFFGVKLPFLFTLRRCLVPDGINLQEAQTRSLNFRGSHLGMLNAHMLQVQGSLYLTNGCRVEGEAKLIRATIAGDLDCENGSFVNPGQIALNADNAEVKGRVFFRGKFEAHGGVRLVRATISGDLDCGDGSFTNTGGVALNADNAEVKGRVFLRGEFEAHGSVRLVLCTIGGAVDCSNGQFLNADADALLISRTSIGGGVFLTGDFQSLGAVMLEGSRIEGNLDCRGARIYCPGKEALAAPMLRARGAGFFIQARPDRPFQTNGIINLTGAHIDGALLFEDVIFYGDENNGVNGTHLLVGGPFTWRNVAHTPTTQLNLRYAKVGVLEDDSHSWPDAEHLILEGLTYEAIRGEEAARPPATGWLRKAVGWLSRWLKRGERFERLDWLQRQPKDRFSLQPYEQLAAVLRQNGQEVEARAVSIAKQECRRKFGRLGLIGWTGSTLSRWLIGHGYRTSLILLYAAVFVVVGTLLFGNFRAELAPTKKAEEIPTAFDPFVYSLDTFIPVMNLHQKEYWIPRGDTYAGQAVRVYYWVHIATGWACFTLAVVGFTGLVRKA